jgi:tetratricopeptide (TPR) repeat protein
MVNLGLKYLLIAGAVTILLSQFSCSNSGRPAPKETDALIEDARRLTDEHKVRQALDTLARAKQADPTRTDIYLLRSSLLEQSANLTEALNEVLAAHKIDPNNPEITMRALKLGINWMRPGESEALAREVVARDPNDPDGHLMLGAAIAMQDRPDRLSEAIRALQEANRLAPESHAPLLELGKVYSRIGDNVKAAAMLETAVSLLNLRSRAAGMSVPDLEGWIEDRSTAAFRLSHVYARMGKTAEAKAAVADTSKWSARSAELRRIKNRAFANPPDSEAQAKLTRIASQGLSYWGK